MPGGVHNGVVMAHRLASLAVLLALAAGGAPAWAEVTRCTDARGAISYTDAQCPPGTRQTGAVDVPATAPPSSPSASPAPLPSQAPPAPSAPAAPQSTPGGLSVIAPEPRPSPESQRWSRRGDDRGEPGFWSGSGAYPGPYPGGYPGGYDDPYYPDYRPRALPARPLIDQRPPLSHCDASGCADTLGNHYDRRGRLDRYQRSDGKTCRPVGSTTICQ